MLRQLPAYLAARLKPRTYYQRLVRALRQHWLSILVAAALSAILLIAAALRLARSRYGLPYPIYWDEPVIVYSALEIMGTGNWEPRYFIYGGFPIYLSVAASSLAFVRDAAVGYASSLAAYTDTTFWRYSLALTTNAHNAFMATRVLFSLFGVGMIGVVYLMARRLGYAVAGLFGALLLAIAPLHIALLQRANVDGIAAACVSVAMLAGLEIVLGAGRRGWYSVAGIACGLAVATKFNAAMAGAVIPVAHLLRPRAQRNAGDLLWGLLLVPASALVAHPYVLLNYPKFLSEMAQAAHHYGTAGHVGHTVARGWPHFSLIMAELSRALGPIGWASALLGLPYLFLRHPRAAAVVLTFPVLYATLMTRQIVYFDRSTLPLLPAAGLLAAVGLGAFARLLAFLAAKQVPLRYRRPAVAASGVLLALLVFQASYGTLRGQTLESLRQLKTPETRLQAVLWLVEHAPPGSRVVVDSRLPFQFSTLTLRGFGAEAYDLSLVTWEERHALAQKFDYMISSEPLCYMAPDSVLAEFPGAPIPLPITEPVGNPRVQIYRAASALPAAQAGALKPGECGQELGLMAFDPNLEALFTDWDAYNKRGHWLMTGNGYADFGPLSAGRGTLTATVYAAGTKGNERYPDMRVVLLRVSDGSEVARQTVRLTAEQAPHPVTFQVLADDTYAIRVLFDDEFYDPVTGGDHNLLLRAVTAAWEP